MYYLLHTAADARLDITVIDDAAIVFMKSFGIHHTSYLIWYLFISAPTALCINHGAFIFYGAIISVVSVAYPLIFSLLQVPDSLSCVRYSPIHPATPCILTSVVVILTLLYLYYRV